MLFSKNRVNCEKVCFLFGSLQKGVSSIKQLDPFKEFLCMMYDFHFIVTLMHHPDKDNKLMKLQPTDFNSIFPLTESVARKEDKSGRSIWQKWEKHLARKIKVGEASGRSGRIIEQE